MPRGFLHRVEDAEFPPILDDEAMHGRTFAYDGQPAGWSYTVYLIESTEDIFAGVADIAFHGRQRCKIVLSLPHVSRGAGVATLGRRSIAWIQQTVSAPGEP